MQDLLVKAKMQDLAIESRSAAKALYLSTVAIQSTETFAKNSEELKQVLENIDPMLKNIISRLWKCKIITRFSCQGHAEGEEGYIYMDYSNNAFEIFSRVMFAVDDYLESKFPLSLDKEDDKIWYHPYIVIERSARKVKDNFSRDELIVRFKFNSANLISREEFYRLLEVSLDTELKKILGIWL